jgi:hypothetical protein
VINIFILVAFKTEKKLEKVIKNWSLVLKSDARNKNNFFASSYIKKEISESKGLVFCCLNVIGALLLPAMYLWYRETNPGNLEEEEEKLFVT